jgi:hypothetical protein
VRLFVHETVADTLLFEVWGRARWGLVRQERKEFARTLNSSGASARNLEEMADHTGKQRSNLKPFMNCTSRRTSD